MRDQLQNVSLEIRANLLDMRFAPVSQLSQCVLRSESPGKHVHITSVHSTSNWPSFET